MNVSKELPPVFGPQGEWIDLPEDVRASLSPVQDRLYVELAESSNEVVTLETNLKAATAAQRATNRRLNETMAALAKAPKLTQADLMRQVAASNRRH